MVGFTDAHPWRAHRPGSPYGDRSSTHAQALAEGHADAAGRFANPRSNAGEGEEAKKAGSQQRVQEHGGNGRHRAQAPPNLEKNGTAAGRTGRSTERLPALQALACSGPWLCDVKRVISTPSGTPIRIARITAMPTRLMCCRVKCRTCDQSKGGKARENSCLPHSVQWMLAQEICGDFWTGFRGQRRPGR